MPKRLSNSADWLRGYATGARNLELELRQASRRRLRGLPTNGALMKLRHLSMFSPFLLIACHLQDCQSQCLRLAARQLLPGGTRNRRATRPPRRLHRECDDHGSSDRELAGGASRRCLALVRVRFTERREPRTLLPKGSPQGTLARSRRTPSERTRRSVHDSKATSPRRCTCAGSPRP